MELINVKQCDGCGRGADTMLVDDDGKILGWYCYPCGERELERIKEQRKPPARCRYNRFTNRPCLLDDKHTGDHDLPCVEASAHRAHAKGGCAADGTLYQCSGHRFDRT